MKALHVRLLVAAVAIAATTCSTFAPAASAARCNDHWALHAGSCGQRVKDLQWMLGGHRPNVFRQVKPTFKWTPNGSFGSRTKSAAIAYKYRIGYPLKGQCGAKRNMVVSQSGPLFMSILRGKTKRSTCWVGLAAQRVKGAIREGSTTAAQRIRALEISQLGVHESPNGSNRGPRISYRSSGVGPYQGSTGAYGAAWCASFGDWALKAVTGHGFGSRNDAYVPTIAEHAQAYNHLAAKPRVGSFVVFLTASGRLADAYHIGFVVKVTASGVQTIEGNSGNAVREVWRSFSAYRMVYVNVPGVA